MFGKKIKELREKNSLTQKQFGELFNLSASAIHELEMGRRNLAKEKLLKLADYFDVSLDWLMGRTDNPQSHKT
jgi:transcriptional regulator with XRE-family HTH domain